MNESIEKMIKYLRLHLGDMYVWGGQGEENPTESWIRRRETSDKNAERAIAFMKKSEKRPIYAFDCSGLIVKFLMDEGFVKSDMTTRGLFALCKDITRNELKAGDFVFRHNGTQIHHVGVFIGDNKVIEAMGRDVGVVERDIDASGKNYWNRSARFEPLFDKEDDNNELYFPASYQYTGSTYVNLRKSAGGEIIGRVSRDETVIVLGVSNGYADVIKVENSRYVRGFCIADYLTRLEN